jgi:anthranilate phosphoribosyltransferase
MSDAVRAALATIVEGGTLTLDEARLAMGAVMDGEATPAQLAALLMGLRMRGETVDELAGFASAMRERSVRVTAPEGAIDVVGTGGDESGTFNISTASALVVAAAGVPVAKHGNRAMTSKAGSADVLDALGVRIDHDAASASAALAELGFAFMFAPNFHPAMKHAGPTRREIGVRTAFNLLGPLTNPAGTTRQLLGVGDAVVAERIAEVAQRLGTERTFVIHGMGVDGWRRPAGWAAAPRTRMPARSRRSSGVSPAPSATSSCSTPEPRSSSRARSSSWRPASRRPP